jgi:hypothetical protein
MSARIIQVRPSRNPRWKKHGGWEVFEAEGVSPVYCGTHRLVRHYRFTRADAYNSHGY